LALAAIYDGGSRGDVGRIGGVGLQIVRDWVVRFNAEEPQMRCSQRIVGLKNIPDYAPFSARRIVVQIKNNVGMGGVEAWRAIVFGFRRASARRASPNFTGARIGGGSEVHQEPPRTVCGRIIISLFGG
jgi:hypothetical protein